MPQTLLTTKEEFIMAMVVKNNMSALSTLNTLNKNTNALSKSLQKVSSGMKINSAADDASGYAISERMRVQIRSLDQANSNAQNGGSMMKVAEGAVSSTVEILKTLKEKAVNAANDTNTDADRATIQKELDQSVDQINDNANVTFNGQYLVDGSKNSKTAGATKTTLTNTSLSADTKVGSAFVKLAARNGDGLNIHKGDTLTISFVMDGKTYTNTVDITNDLTLDEAINGYAKTDVNNTGAQAVLSFTGQTKDSTGAATTTTGDTNVIGLDKFGNEVKTSDGASALTLTASTAGIKGQIAGFTMYITDNTGKVNKSANAVLDAFTESIRAENDSKKDNSIIMQVGTKAGQSIKVGLTDMKAAALGLQGEDGKTLSVGNKKDANAAINVLDSAIQKALDQQTTIGAVESRLEYTQSNLTTASENVTAAESTIRDADMAKEMTDYTKNNVLMQAAQSMLAQANQSSSNALSLLQ